MSEIDPSVLGVAFDAANANAEWSTLIVAVGIVVEVAVLFIFSKEMSTREKALLIFANILVVGGVGGEYIFGKRASDAASQLQRISDERVATLNDRALKDELELAKLTNSRIITNEHISNLLAILRPYAGNTFWVITEKNETDVGGEQERLAAQISGIFLSAGWHKDNHASQVDSAKIDPEVTPVSDRGCQVDSSDEPKSATLVKLITDSLNDAGVECLPFLSPELKPDHLVIEIGLR
jgi:hypothetical protein